MVMVSNNSGREARELAAQYPGRIGHLNGPEPTGCKGPFPEFPYALDNGAFGGFDRAAWMKMLEWCDKQEQRPLWAAVPDVVGDPTLTLRNWFAFRFYLTARDIPAAYVLQDGNKPGRVPHADIYFIGGTDEGKRQLLRDFSGEGLRLHVGRVNGIAMLDSCYELGVESVDGTGWFRGRQGQLAELKRFLRETAGEQRAGWLY